MNLVGSIFLGMMLLCLLVVMILLIVGIVKMMFESDSSSNRKTKWVTELNPTNGKFYISRQAGSNTEYVRNHFWLRKGYKDQVKAELIVDLLNK